MPRTPFASAALLALCLALAALSASGGRHDPEPVAADAELLVNANGRSLKCEGVACLIDLAKRIVGEFVDEFLTCGDCCGECDYLYGGCKWVKEGWIYRDDKCFCKEGYEKKGRKCVKKAVCPHCCASCNGDITYCHQWKDGWYYKDHKCVCKEGYVLHDGHCLKVIPIPPAPSCPHCCGECDYYGNCKWWKHGWFYKDHKCICKDWEGYVYHDGKCVQNPVCPHCCGSCSHGTCDWWKEGYAYKDGKCVCKDWEGYQYQDSKCVKTITVIHRPEFHCPHCCGGCNYPFARCDWYKEGWAYKDNKCVCKDWEGFYHLDGKCVKHTPYSG